MRVIICSCLVFLGGIALAQSGIQTDFGQNRIQYHDDFDDWYMYETQNFVTYWYGKSRNVGQLTLSLAEYDFKSIESILEHKLNDKIEIICYTDVSDLKQSNIGTTDIVIGNNDKTLVSGNKLFVYFDGDHNHLRKQIREGIGEIYLNAMIYGSGLSSFVQKSVKLKIPDWFKEGLVAYLGEEWSTKADNQLRDVLQVKSPKKKFEQLAKEYPRLMGYAFWNYLTREYGKSNVSNILYLTRINRSTKSAFLYILGIPFDQITSDCLAYFRSNYSEDKKILREVQVQNALRIKNKKRLPVTHTRISPDGNTLAYAVNNKGRYKVYIQGLRNGKPRKVLSGGIKNNVQETDYLIPVFAWHPTRNEMVFVTEKSDEWWLYKLDLQSQKLLKDKISPEYQRIYQVDYINDNSLLFNASTDALSDLYMYLPITRESKRLTQDFYDDLNASYGTLMGKKGILFKSNRPMDTLFTMPVDTLLPIQPFNLYFLPYDPVDNANTKKLTRLTANHHFDLDQPAISGTNQVSYLSDEYGVKQRKSIQINELGQTVQSMTAKGDHHVYSFHSADGKAVGSVTKGYKTYLLREQAGFSIDSMGNRYTVYRTNQSKERKISGISLTDKPATPSDSKSAYQSDFQSEFPDAVPIETKKETADQQTQVVAPLQVSPAEQDPIRFNPLRTQIPEKFQFTRMIASRLKFKIDDVVSTVDNSLLFGGLNSYAGQNMGFEYPPAGFLIKAKIKDIFEDYALEGGVRIPTNFNGTEYFLIFDNNKRRIDKRFAIYRQTRYETEELTAVLAQRRRNRTMIAVSQFKFPFDVYSSVRLSGTMRFDRSTLLATDLNTINEIPTTTQRLGLRMEYVYDNATPIDINRFTGVRAKIYAEAVKKMQIQIVDDWKLDLSKGFMTVLGFDARHYLGLDRRTILATRLSGATSMGSERILFFLGGVDNWIAPQYDDDTPIPAAGDAEYAYYALGAHLRGFKQNIRNGTSHVLLNTELRVPFVQYFSSRELRSAFLRNLQLVGFFDAGTAWFGRNPFDQDSPLNTTSVSNPLVKIDLVYSRDPLVFGYGTGLRMSLMGYQLRADYAWGVETRERLKPRFYFSLGSDF